MSAESYCQACQMYHMPEQWYEKQIEISASVMHPAVKQIRENNIRFLEKHRENMLIKEGESVDKVTD